MSKDLKNGLAEVHIFTKEQFIVVGVALVLLPLFEPRSLTYVAELNPLNTLYSFGKVLSGLVVLFLLGKGRVINLFSIGIALFSGAMLFSALMAGDDFARWLSGYGAYSLVAFFVAALHENHDKELLQGVLVVSLTLLLLNFASMIAFPNGLYLQEGSSQIDNYFWGHRNRTYQIAVPAVLSSLLLDNMKGKRLGSRSLFILMISYIEVIAKFSVTSFVALSVFTIGFILMRIDGVRKLLNPGVYGFGYFIAFVLIVLMRVQVHFGDFLRTVFHRPVDLSGRTEIWDLVFHFMDESHALTGYGLSAGEYLRVFKTGFAHAHNEVLNIWFCGGFIALAFFIFIVILALLKLYGARRSQSCSLIGLGLCCLFVIGLTEVVSCSAFYFILAFGYCEGIRKDYQRSIADRTQ